MKSLKMSGPVRLLAFVLIAVILIFVITIAVGGKQSNPENEPDSGDVASVLFLAGGGVGTGYGWKLYPRSTDESSEDSSFCQ